MGCAIVIVGMYVYAHVAPIPARTPDAMLAGFFLALVLLLGMLIALSDRR